MLDQTRIHEGRLTVSEVMTDKPTTVRVGTPLSQVAEILSASHFRHVLVNDEQGRLVGVVSSNELLGFFSQAAVNGRIDVGRTYIESLMTTKFLAGSPDTEAQAVAPMIANGSIKCMPVLEGDRLVGVLTSTDLLLSWNRINPALREASQDAVTELASRATFERRLDEEWSRSQRNRTPLSLLIVDLDRFKEINDTCGHQTGDAVLQMVGSCLRRALRGYDVVARIGGDEFAAVCVECNTENVVAPIRRLNDEIRSLTVPHEAGRRSITMSIGVAVIRRGFAQFTSNELRSAADACLYQAKRNGRDRAYAVDLSATESAPQLIENESELLGI